MGGPVVARSDHRVRDALKETKTSAGRNNNRWSAAASGTEHRRGLPIVCVGVTGHRPNGLNSADLPLLRRRVRECLELIRGTAFVRSDPSDTTGHQYAAPWLFSPLAEGADRIVAEEALDLGFDLVCPLPFPVAEYERDFGTEASLRQFRTLLQRAAAVYELDGSRATQVEADRSYAAAGEMVLADSDVLIAVWDGMAAKGSGGTELVVQAAISAGTPVIWIEAGTPHTTHLVVGDATGAWTRGGLDHLSAAMNQGSVPD